MRIIGIKINNYKSFSDMNNVLRFDFENTLALIGKNETGKSNTLLALKDLCFFDTNMKTDIFENRNRISNNEVEISIDVEFNESDFPDEKNNINKYISRFIFKKENGQYVLNFDGCLSDILNSDEELRELSAEILKFNASYQQENNVRLFKQKVQKYSSTFIRLNNAESLFNMDAVKKEKFSHFKSIMENYYNEFRNVLPKIIYFSNTMVLKNKYTYENIIKKEDIIGLKFLLEALNFTIEDLKQWLTTNDGAQKQKYYLKFKNQVDQFNKEFQKFYKTNKIELLFNVDSKNIEFTIKDNTEDMSITNFSERSDGLKWYLSMFIQLYSTRKKYNYSLILLDEPGNSLHVIAQKKLLELLLITENFQIIYTTHSPYMIDIEHLENIRLIIKDKYTNIVNGINNSKKKGSKSFKETLTPILEAIGLSINYNFGPSPNKLNLVVEGITDYFYIKTMIRIFNIDENKVPNIIPCVGATNESNIVSILIGWGYDFKCLFDNDKEGLDETNKLKKSLEDSDNKIFFVSDEYGHTIENLICEKTACEIKSSSKTLTAKKFSMMVEKKELEVDQITKNNFKKLFKKIGIM